MLQPIIYIWKLEGGGGNNVGQYVAKYKNNTLCLTLYRKTEQIVEDIIFSTFC